MGVVAQGPTLISGDMTKCMLRIAKRRQSMTNHLARPSLCDTNHVTTAQPSRDRLCLNRGGFCVSELDDCAHDGIVKPTVRKAHDGLRWRGPRHLHVLHASRSASHEHHSATRKVSRKISSIFSFTNVHQHTLKKNNHRCTGNEFFTYPNAKLGTEVAHGVRRQCGDFFVFSVEELAHRRIPTCCQARTR